MEIIKDIVSLIASILIFLESIIALINTTGIVKFQDVFLENHASTRSPTLLVLLAVVSMLIYLTVNSGFFGVRLLLSLVFISLTPPTGMHLISRTAYRNGTYMYRKDDASKRSTILLSQKEFGTPEELKKRVKLREKGREELYYKEREYIDRMDD